MAAFAILITAPLGAILINLTGPLLLTKAVNKEIEEEFPNGEGVPEEFKDEGLDEPQVSGDHINNDDELNIVYQGGENVRGSKLSGLESAQDVSDPNKTQNGPEEAPPPPQSNETPRTSLKK